jgi:ankyrin repeat protein
MKVNHVLSRFLSRFNANMTKFRAKQAIDLIAAAFKSPDTMLAFVRSDPALLESRTGLGETPLHYLAVENQLKAVLSLLAAGAEVNTVNSVGGTPLSEAASLGYEEMVDLLIAHGARLHLPGQMEPTLHEATRSANGRVVELVLRAGAEVNERNDMKETALHLAAESEDRLVALEALLDAGADTTARALFGDTPLDVAVRQGSNACTAALMARGGAIHIE